MAPVRNTYVCTDVWRIARVSSNLRNVYTTHDGEFGDGNVYSHSLSREKFCGIKSLCNAVESYHFAKTCMIYVNTVANGHLNHMQYDLNTFDRCYLVAYVCTDFFFDNSVQIISSTIIFHT